MPRWVGSGTEATLVGWAWDQDYTGGLGLGPRLHWWVGLRTGNTLVGGAWDLIGLGLGPRLH